MIVEGSGEFAQAALHLYSDRSLWQQISTNGLEHVGENFSRQALRRQIAIALGQRTVHKRATPSTRGWSSLLVEKRFPETLTGQPSGQRLAYRQWAYYQIAEQLRAEGKPKEALKQLRHIFSFTRIQPLNGDLYDQVLTSMAACYADLSDRAGEARCLAGKRNRLAS
jgi:hypothetical protein